MPRGPALVKAIGQNFWLSFCRLESWRLLVISFSMIQRQLHESPRSVTEHFRDVIPVGECVVSSILSFEMP